MELSYIITGSSITLNYNGETHSVVKDNPAYDKVKLAIKEGRLDEIPDLVDAAKRVSKATGGLFTIKDGLVYVDDTEVPTQLGQKILDFEQEGLPFEPLVNFARKLNKNPSYRSVKQLFTFLEANSIPITATGNFIAYKKVRPDFKDIYSGKFDNSPGKTVSMPRNQVNEDPSQTCQAGLHVAAFPYANNSYGSSTDTILEVEVDPSNVVAVPIDYNSQKMRVCEYLVKGVVKNPTTDKHLVGEQTYKSQACDHYSDEEMEPFEEECVCSECHCEYDLGDSFCKDCGNELP